MEEPASHQNEDRLPEKESAELKTTAEPDLLVGHTMSRDTPPRDTDTPDSLLKSTDSLQGVTHDTTDEDAKNCNLNNNYNSNDSLDEKHSGDDHLDSRDSPDSESQTALRLSRTNLSGKDSSPALSPRERDRAEKIRQMREKQQKDQERKVEELREASRIAQETRDRQLEERRKKLDEIRRRDNERRQAVEERRRQAEQVDKERREILLKKQAEREQKIESMKLQLRKDDRPLAFGSRTPREICLVDSSLQRSPSLHMFSPMHGAAKKRMSRSVPPRPHHCCFPQDGNISDSPPRRPRPRSSMGHPLTSTAAGDSPKPASGNATARRSRSAKRTTNFNPRSRSMGAAPMTSLLSSADRPKIDRKTPTPRGNLHPVDQLTSPKRNQNSPREHPAERPPSRGPVKVIPIQPAVKKTSKEEKPKPEKPAPEKWKQEKPAAKPKTEVPKASDGKNETKAPPTAEELEYKAKLAEKRRQAREKAAREAEEAKLKESSPDAEAEFTTDELDQEPVVETQEEETVDEEAMKEAERLAEEARKAEEERLQKAIAEEEERKRLEAEKAEEERLQREEQERKAKEEAEKMEKERLEKQQKEEEERNERKKRLEMIMKRVKNDNSPVPRATSPAPEPELSKVVDNAIIDNARNLKSPEPGSFKSAYLQNIMQKRQQAAADKSGENSRAESPDKPDDDQDTTTPTVENGASGAQDEADTSANGPPTPEIQDAVMKPIENESESISSVDSPSADRSSESNLDQVIELDNQANLSKNGDLSDIINFNTDLTDQPTTRVAFEADNNAHLKENSVNEVEVT